MIRRPKEQPEEVTALAELIKAVRDLRATVAKVRIHLDRTIPEGHK